MDLELYSEFAIGTKFNRGKFFKESNVDQIINSKYAHGLIYKSVYSYDRDVVEYHKLNKTMKRYDGIRYISEVVFDIDKKTNTDEYTHSKAKRLLQFLEDLGLDENEYQIYWSGTAWHFHTSNKSWGFKPSKDLPYTVKETMRKLLEPLGKGFYDESIYMATGMFRLANSFNDKPNAMLYKIPVSKNEFLSMKVDDIKELAKTQRLDFDLVDFSEILDSQVNKLAKHIVVELEQKERLNSFSKTIQKSNVAICIHRLIDRGAMEGNRNQVVLRIATHMRRNNIPEDFTVAGLLNGWNNKNNQGLDEKQIKDIVSQSYRSPYNYGCNDKILQFHCRPDCIFAQHKNYSQHILSTEDMMNELKQYRDMDRTGRTINLAELFGLKNKDIIAEPGDLIMVVGGTGVNKTTLKQQIALAMNFETGIIDYSKQIPTLSIELELSSAKVMRRMIQQICGVSKEQVLANLDEYEEMSKQAMANIIFTREIRNIASLRSKIIETQAKLIIIDYLQCFKDFNRTVNDMQHMQALPHELRDLATETGTIIMAISQVTKDAKAQKSVNMDSGKGSGDIADSSSIIITINGQPDDIYRTIKFEKVTDGDTVNDGVILQFNKDNFRLEKLTEL